MRAFTIAAIATLFAAPAFAYQPAEEAPEPTETETPAPTDEGTEEDAEG